MPSCNSKLMKKLARSWQNLVQKSQTTIFFKQSICWDPALTLTYVPSFVPGVLFDWPICNLEVVLSSRFNKIQTHKTVTIIYTVYLLLRILLTQSWLIQTNLTKLVVIPTKLGWMSKWLGADIDHNKVLGRMGGWAVLWSLRTITGSISGRGNPTSDRSSDQWWLWWGSSSS